MLLKYIIIVELLEHNVMYTVETDNIITLIKNEFNNKRFNRVIISSNIYEYSEETYEQLYKFCKIHYDIGANYGSISK